MPKITKSQQKRLVEDIRKKAQKLFMMQKSDYPAKVLNVNDMIAIEKICDRVMKRIK